MIKTIYVILIMATLVVAIIFAWMNRSTVALNYLFGETEVGLYIVIYAMFLFGLLSGVLLDAWIMYRQRARIRKLEKAAEANQKELSNLRKLPLRDLKQ